ncbi:MAG: PKD domain-containing protein [Bacteroidetes bacterium]|nr:PKD domain-containing protein [Bacteroidota bacterium]
MNRIKLFPVVFTMMVFLGQIAYGQGTINKKRKCGTNEAHLALIQKDPTYLERYNKLQKFVNNFVLAHPDGYSPKVVVTVPVVFHIVLSSAQMSSFADSRIQEQITVLNQDYGGQNTHSMGSFATTLKANTDLQFCLAETDPSGNSTTGIEHLTSTHGAWYMSSDIKHTSTGGMDQWDPDKYLNIWVCDLGGGLCGWAQYPTAPLSNEFGLVCHYEYVGVTGASAPYNLGGTASHEIGHCFNLQHIWGDSGGCSPDDQCTDTPVQDAETYGAPTGVVTDACSAASPGIMYMNFLDYVDDIAYANFTPNQKTRIQACFAAGGSLEQLGQSDACQPSNGLNANFSGTPLTGNPPLSVTFTNSSTGVPPPNSWIWSFPGGTPSSFSGQTPPTIVYSTPGGFDVTLIVSNGTTTDTLTQNGYVQVNGPPPTANFAGNPLTVVVNGSVTFTDLSTNNPSSWVWNFPGGTPSSYSGLTPPPLVYSAVGVYNVSLSVANNNGGDTLIKTNYIHVVLPNYQHPVANFIAEQTTLLVGDSTNFIDLSTGIPLTWQWKFTGGTPSTANIQNPMNIKYNAVGNYLVTLTVANTNGSDSLKKQAYIHVVSNIGTQPPVVEFDASARLIPINTTIYFTDESTNNPQMWDWSFQGGSPATSDVQNPTGITYNNPGQYCVTLKVANLNGDDSLTKCEYIIVTPSYMNNYCDTITNIGHSESVCYRRLSDTWGMLPGPNGKGIKAYADKFTDYTWSEVDAILVPVKIASPGSSSSTIRFRIWGGSDIPSSELGYEDLLLNTFHSDYYKLVTFNPPVHVDGTFFVGWEVQYGTSDTLVVTMAVDRGPSGLNTLYVKQASNAWSTCKDVFGLTTSLGIEPVVCLISDVSVQKTEDNLLIFPNPSHDMINIQAEDENMLNGIEVKVFDMLGKLVNVTSGKPYANMMQLDFSNKNTGIYFLQIIKGNRITVKKISIY